MTDREAIAELVHEYDDAVIHGDARRWRACWAPNATWNYAGGRSVQGVDAIVELWLGAMARYEQVVQLTHSGSVRVEGDRASGRWHFSHYGRRVDGSISMLLAYYDDRYARTDRTWRFEERALQVLYDGPPDLSAPFQRPGDR